MSTYNLQSSGLLYAPGFIRWVRNMHRTQPTLARKIVKETWDGLSDEAIRNIVKGTYRVEGDVVKVEG